MNRNLKIRVFVKNVFFFFKKYFLLQILNPVVFKRPKSCYLKEMTFQITLRPPPESSLLPLWPVDGKDSLFVLMISHSGDLFHQLRIIEKGKQGWILKFNTKKKILLGWTHFSILLKWATISKTTTVSMFSLFFSDHWSLLRAE